MQPTQAFIFDLDGVIVDTAHFHYLSWKQTAASFNYHLTKADNEQLKGVSRVDSLNKILAWADHSLSSEEFDKTLIQKNDDYLLRIQQIGPQDALDGVAELLSFLQEKSIPVALGSASKNAPLILKYLELSHFFQALIDGTQVTKSKPDPEVFLKGAEALGVAPENCLVFEDAAAGVAAAKHAGMQVVGLGDAEILHQADYHFKCIAEIPMDFYQQRIQQS
ncbi:MAG: beta-phosphoglucomutase [Flavobacteriaceae bacterium]